jgi:hypothetical protein
MSGDAAELAGVVVVTLVVGALTGVIPTAGIFNARERETLRNQMQGNPDRLVPHGPSPTRAQYAWLGVFLISYVVVVVVPPGAVAYAGAALLVASAVALVALRVHALVLARRARGRHEEPSGALD